MENRADVDFSPPTSQWLPNQSRVSESRKKSQSIIPHPTLDTKRIHQQTQHVPGLVMDVDIKSS